MAVLSRALPQCRQSGGQVIIAGMWRLGAAGSATVTATVQRDRLVGTSPLGYAP